MLFKLNKSGFILLKVPDVCVTQTWVSTTDIRLLFGVLAQPHNTVLQFSILYTGLPVVWIHRQYFFKSYLLQQIDSLRLNGINVYV